MATSPTPMPRQPKPKKQPKPVEEKHSITITFEEKYKNLYDEISRSAEFHDRTVSQYVLLFLRDNHGKQPVE